MLAPVANPAARINTTATSKHRLILHFILIPPFASLVSIPSDFRAERDWLGALLFLKKDKPDHQFGNPAVSILYS
jgi:hypothetical protein